MLRVTAAVVVLFFGSGVAAGQSLSEWAEPGEVWTFEDPEVPTGWDPMRTPTPPPVPSVVPVDGGLALLALAGGAFALRRLRSS